jgi:hypothetical protein
MSTRPARSAGSSVRRTRTIWIAEAHRGDGQRFVVRADEKLTAFTELEAAIRAVSGRFRRPKVILGQNAVSVSQVLQSFCDTTPHNGGHGNKTNFSEIRCRRQRCFGPALDGTASVCDQTCTQHADQVYPTAASARCWNRGRDSKRNESLLLHATGNCATTASQPAANAVMGV